MPYIKQEKRGQYSNIVNELVSECMSNNPSVTIIDDVISHSIGYLTNNGNVVLENSDSWKGELNYLISKCCHELIKLKGLKYHVLNDIIGILVNCDGCPSETSNSNWKDILKYFIKNLTWNIIYKNPRIGDELAGILECCKLELYRTVIAGYEDKKCAKNGSVSELDDKSMERMR
jgi:hypothetical protein